MKAGEKLSKEDFLYISKTVDKEEKREWSDYVTDDIWKELRWEAYQRRKDVDIVLSAYLRREVVTKSLFRWI